MVEVLLAVCLVSLLANLITVAINVKLTTESLKNHLQVRLKKRGNDDGDHAKGD